MGKKDPSAFVHTENIYLLDRERRIRGIYKALDKDSLKLLLKDLAALEKPATTP
jgi:cytochrome oxidase Cu insertion factor (SCO1/SenC/PrrC family)